MGIKIAMKHPGVYTTVPYNGYHFMIVDSGTTISDERTGTEETVDYNCVVVKVRVIWCTQVVFDKIKAMVKSNVH